ncbi:MAG: hypothetical protein RIE78_09380 [Roseitalea porphyridii]
MKTALANAWLRSAPDGPAERQVLFGDDFIVERTEAGHAYGRTVKDDYPGCLPVGALGPGRAVSAFVAVRTTWAYAAPDIKSEPLLDLHLTSRLELLDGGTRDWHAFRLGDATAFVPSRHCRTWGDFFDDPATVARVQSNAPDRRPVRAQTTGDGSGLRGADPVKRRRDRFFDHHHVMGVRMDHCPGSGRHGHVALPEDQVAGLQRRVVRQPHARHELLLVAVGRTGKPAGQAGRLDQT